MKRFLRLTLPEDSLAGIRLFHEGAERLPAHLARLLRDFLDAAPVLGALTATGIVVHGVEAAPAPLGSETVIDARHDALQRLLRDAWVTLRTVLRMLSTEGRLGAPRGGDDYVWRWEPLTHDTLRRYSWEPRSLAELHAVIEELEGLYRRLAVEWGAGSRCPACTDGERIYMGVLDLLELLKPGKRDAEHLELLAAFAYLHEAMHVALLHKQRSLAAAAALAAELAERHSLDPDTPAWHVAGYTLALVYIVADYIVNLRLALSHPELYNAVAESVEGLVDPEGFEEYLERVCGIPRWAARRSTLETLSRDLLHCLASNSQLDAQTLYELMRNTGRPLDAEGDIIVEPEEAERVVKRLYEGREKKDASHGGLVRDTLRRQLGRAILEGLVELRQALERVIEELRVGKERSFLRASSFRRTLRESRRTGLPPYYAYDTTTTWRRVTALISLDTSASMMYEEIFYIVDALRETLKKLRFSRVDVMLWASRLYDEGEDVSLGSVLQYVAERLMSGGTDPTKPLSAILERSKAEKLLVIFVSDYVFLPEDWGAFLEGVERLRGRGSRFIAIHTSIGFSGDDEDARIEELMTVADAYIKFVVVPGYARVEKVRVNA